MKAGLTALAVAASFVAAACGGSSTGGTGGSAGSGGQGATAGSGGTGGGPAGPRKLDVLLVVDDSISMGLRQLEVVRDTMGVAASICPKSNDSSTPGYGYHPAFDAIIERLR